MTMNKEVPNHKKGRMRLLVIAGIVLGVLVLALGAFYVFFNNPLAPQLQTPRSTGGTNPTSTGEAQSTLPESTTASTGPNLCGQSGVWTILAVGQDYRGEGDEYLYGLADVIRLMRIDFSKGSIAMLAIPRDLWVRFPVLEGVSSDYGKINQAYFFGTPAMGHYTGKAGGAGLLADTLNLNYGIFPDHYVVVSMNAFVHIIDAVGGIDVTLTEAVDGNVKFNMGYYPAGTYHFNGSQALMFSRIRYGYTELKRIDNETIIMNALYDKINSPTVKVDLLEIARAFLEEEAVLTDLSPADLATLACVATSIDRSTIKSATLPKETFTGQMIYSGIQHDDTFAYVPDNAKVQKVIDDFKAGIWP